VVYYRFRYIICRSQSWFSFFVSKWFFCLIYSFGDNWFADRVFDDFGIFSLWTDAIMVYGAWYDMCFGGGRIDDNKIRGVREYEVKRRFFDCGV
jgi:hypothetical protein